MFECADGERVLQFGSLLAFRNGASDGNAIREQIGRCRSVIAELGLDPLFQRPGIPLGEELGDAETVWCAWRTGSVRALGGGIARHGRVVRLILGDPEMETSPGGMVADLAHAAQVMAVTDLAIRVGISVAWLDGDVGCGLVIANPFGPGGWARVEFPIPGVQPSRRPGVRIHADRDPDIFAFLCRRFCDMAAASSPAEARTVMVEDATILDRQAFPTGIIGWLTARLRVDHPHGTFQS